MSASDRLERRLRRLEDLEAIRLLDAQYCRVLDAGDWDELADLFIPDGEFVGLGRARGREELRTFFAGLTAAGLTAFWHHVTNLEIRLATDREPCGGEFHLAHTRSLLWQPCVVHGVAHVAAGQYTDTLVRTADGWRDQAKRVSFDYFTRLADGWDLARFSLPTAAATYRGGSTR
jgi:hypothetical protein